MASRLKLCEPWLVSYDIIYLAFVIFTLFLALYVSSFDSRNPTWPLADEVEHVHKEVGMSNQLTIMPNLWRLWLIWQTLWRLMLLRLCKLCRGYANRAEPEMGMVKGMLMIMLREALTREAQHWWQAECHLLQLQNANVPWEVFQTTFYKRYFLESTREAKEMKLMQLKQGSISVADYTNKFEELCRFSRVCQGALETYESWKCIKYQRGLKDNIMTDVAPMEIHTFSDLVNKARVVEEYAKSVAASRETHGGTSSKGHDKYFHLRGQNFNRGGYMPQGQGGFRRNAHDQFQRGKGRGNQSKNYSDLTYDRCGYFHPYDSCNIGLGGCFNYGLPGLIAKDCTCRKNPSAGQASHSFVSFAKVEKLGLKVSELPFDLHVDGYD
ncbi:uncharacterized protein LOC107484712 [Arachis duranensis]|uniref:Uncharacterized protein LOC107484712 n=1 Tax=Arachis duranensis TaxID=130453 RepID=A0A6P4D3F9_ARADU|nr:uncharacterized protein LOC107484712 [Arachis duranensis]